MVHRRPGSHLKWIAFLAVFLKDRLRQRGEQASTPAPQLWWVSSKYQQTQRSRFWLQQERGNKSDGLKGILSVSPTLITGVFMEHLCSWTHYYLYHHKPQAREDLWKLSIPITRLMLAGTISAKGVPSAAWILLWPETPPPGAACFISEWLGQFTFFFFS